MSRRGAWPVAVAVAAGAAGADVVTVLLTDS
jgi:hypothetical protein